MSVIKDFWAHKDKKYKNIINNKKVISKSKYCFDYSMIGCQPLSTIKFNSNNWNDYLLMELRDFLDEMKNHGKIETENYWIYYNWNNDQNNYYFLSKGLLKDIVISIYKNRGRIERMIDVNSGNSINLEDMTQLYLDLGLTDGYNKEEFELLL